MRGNKITLTEPLKYEHIAVDGTFGSRTVEFRGEVGHFTRNVKVQGYRNVDSEAVVEHCPEGFDTGIF